jgi:hypothetical protein
MRPQEYAGLSMTTDVMPQWEILSEAYTTTGRHILIGPQGYIGEVKPRRSKAFPLLIPTIQVFVCVAVRLAHRRHSSAYPSLKLFRDIYTTRLQSGSKGDWSALSLGAYDPVGSHEAQSPVYFQVTPLDDLTGLGIENVPPFGRGLVIDQRNISLESCLVVTSKPIDSHSFRRFCACKK